MMTKPLRKDLIDKHMKSIEQTFEQGRATTAPTLDAIGLAGGGTGDQWMAIAGKEEQHSKTKVRLHNKSRRATYNPRQCMSGRRGAAGIGPWRATVARPTTGGAWMTWFNNRWEEETGQDGKLTVVFCSLTWGSKALQWRNRCFVH